MSEIPEVTQSSPTENNISSLNRTKAITVEVLTGYRDKIGEANFLAIQERMKGELLTEGMKKRLAELGPDREKEATIALEAAYSAYLVVRELAGKVDTTWPKIEDARQIYSLADEVSSEIIGKCLKGATPEYGYLDEEVPPEEVEKQEKCWIVDPVDGSAAVVRKIPGWAVGIALHEKNDVEKGGTGITMGIIVSPQFDESEVLIGGKSIGCFDRQGNPVRVSNFTEPKDLSISLGSRDVRLETTQEEGFIGTIQEMGRNVSRVFSGIDTQHAGALLARGSLDMLIRTQQPSYDVSPVIGVVEGAGGKVLDMKMEGHHVSVIGPETALVVQRDKKRRHNLVAWNGKTEVHELLSHSLWTTGEMHRDNEGWPND